MLGIPTPQIPIYREETKPQFCPVPYQSHGDHGLSTSQSRLVAVVPTWSEGTGLQWPVGPYQTRPRREAGGHLQSRQEDRRWVRNSLQCLRPCKTYSSWHSHIQSNKKTCLRPYKEGVDGNGTLLQTYTDITGDHIPSPGHCAAPHTMFVQLALCDHNIKDMGRSQENYTELALFLTLKYLAQHSSSKARLIILGSSECCKLQFGVKKSIFFLPSLNFLFFIQMESQCFEIQHRCSLL